METAARTGSAMAGVISAKPGRRIISVPRKPTRVAVQRRARTTSPSTSAAPAVANSGTVKLSATASPSGSSASALNQVIMVASAKNARSRWSLMRVVRKAPNPARASQGSMNRSAKRLRKKATSSAAIC